MLGNFNEILIINHCGWRVKEVSEVAEELNEVLAHGLDFAEPGEEGRSDQHQRVGVQAAVVGVVQAVVLQEFLEHKHNWLQVSLLEAEFLNEGDALDARVHILNREAVEAHLLALVFIGYIDSQISHILIYLIYLLL